MTGPSTDFQELRGSTSHIRVLGIFREALGFVWKRTQHRNHHQLKSSQGSCGLSWAKDMPKRWIPSGHGMQDFHNPTRKRLTGTRPSSTSGPGGPGSPFSPCEASKGLTGGSVTDSKSNYRQRSPPSPGAGVTPHDFLDIRICIEAHTHLR